MKSTDRVDGLRIASPCPANWEKMTGDDRVRFCDLCNLHVYNIARLSRTEAVELIANTEGRICARLYRRTDGTVITNDCPVGLRALRRHVAKAAGVVFAAIVSLAASVTGQKPSSKDKTCQQQVKITKKLSEGPGDTGRLTGTILDSHGAIVPGAKIVLTNQATGKTYDTESNNEGRILFGDLPVGTYKIAIKSLGFNKTEVTDVKIAAKEILKVELVLLPETTTVTIGVIGGAELIDTTSSSTTIIISEETLRKLPRP